MRVVLDTNVFISGLLFGGNPARVLQLAEARLFELLTSPPIRREVERVLEEKFKWPASMIALACNPLWQIGRDIHPSVQVTDCPDPDDNRILECALEGRAQFIVSGDHHLLDMKRFAGIPIVRIDQFLSSAPQQ